MGSDHKRSLGNPPTRVADRSLVGYVGGFFEQRGSLSKTQQNLLFLLERVVYGFEVGVELNTRGDFKDQGLLYPTCLS